MLSTFVTVCGRSQLSDELSLSPRGCLLLAQQSKYRQLNLWTHPGPMACFLSFLTGMLEIHNTYVSTQPLQKIPGDFVPRSMLLLHNNSRLSEVQIGTYLMYIHHAKKIRYLHVVESSQVDLSGFALWVIY